MCFPTFLTLNVTFFKEFLITGGRIDLSLQMNLVLNVSNFNYAYLVKSALVKRKSAWVCHPPWSMSLHINVYVVVTSPLSTLSVGPMNE